MRDFYFPLAVQAHFAPIDNAAALQTRRFARGCLAEYSQSTLHLSFPMISLVAVASSPASIALSKSDCGSGAGIVARSNTWFPL